MWDDPAVAALLTWPVLPLVWLGAFLGALAVGGAGFAFALVASAIWLHVLDPVHTTLLIVACGTVLHTGLVWRMRRSIEPGRLWPFVVAGLAGIPVGVWLLAHINADALKMAIGIFLACYGLYALLAPRLPQIGGGGQAADGAIGFIAGILGGLGGYSGVLPTIWTQLRGWPKEIARAVYQPFILVAQITTLIIVGFVAIDIAGVLLLVAALPALLAGAWIGWHIYGRLDERRFRQVLAVILIVSGVALWF